MLDILIVDDDLVLREEMVAAIRSESYRVSGAADGREALSLLARRTFDLVLCDDRLPDVDGASLSRRVRSLSPKTAVLLMTSFGDANDAAGAIRAGALDYLVKPVDVELLVNDVLRPMDACGEARRA